MVNVEPFIYQKMTAFRERIQMVDKINEMIEVLNNGIDSEEVRAIITEELSNYYDKAKIDEMFDAIDFSPYYTKTEVNTIVTRIDGDVDAVEGKVNTAEGDIDNLEGRMDTAEGDIDDLKANKQNNLTVGHGLSLVNDKIDLSGWEVIPKAEWNNYYDSTNNCTTEDIMVIIRTGNYAPIPGIMRKGIRDPVNIHLESKATNHNFGFRALYVTPSNVFGTSGNTVNPSSAAFAIQPVSQVIDGALKPIGYTMPGNVFSSISLNKAENYPLTVDKTIVLLRRA